MYTELSSHSRGNQGPERSGSRATNQDQSCSERLSLLSPIGLLLAIVLRQAIDCSIVYILCPTSKNSGQKPYQHLPGPKCSLLSELQCPQLDIEGLA